MSDPPTFGFKDLFDGLRGGARGVPPGASTMKCAQCGADVRPAHQCSACGGSLHVLPKISAEKNSHIRAGALAVVALVFFAGWGIHHSMVSATGGIPPCQAVGAATNNMRCFGNTESDLLRAQLLDDCALGDDVIERNWWQDNVHSIEFNYTGQAGLNHGASIDVQTKIVICE